METHFVINKQSDLKLASVTSLTGHTVPPACQQPEKTLSKHWMHSKPCRSQRTRGANLATEVDVEGLRCPNPPISLPFSLSLFSLALSHSLHSWLCSRAQVYVISSPAECSSPTPAVLFPTQQNNLRLHLGERGSLLGWSSPLHNNVKGPSAHP